MWACNRAFNRLSSWFTVVKLSLYVLIILHKTWQWLLLRTCLVGSSEWLEISTTLSWKSRSLRNWLLMWFKFSSNLDLRSWYCWELMFSWKVNIYNNVNKVKAIESVMKLTLILSELNSYLVTIHKINSFHNSEMLEMFMTKSAMSRLSQGTRGNFTIMYYYAKH